MKQITLDVRDDYEIVSKGISLSDVGNHGEEQIGVEISVLGVVKVYAEKTVKEVPRQPSEILSSIAGQTGNKS